MHVDLNDCNFIIIKACRTCTTKHERNLLAWRLPQLYVFSPHTLGKLLNNNIIDKILHFPPLWSKSHEKTMVSHWLIDSRSSAPLSSAEAIGIGLHEVSIGIGLHEVSWGEGGARGATGRRKKEEKASAGYCPVLRSF